MLVLAPELESFSSCSFYLFAFCYEYMGLARLRSLELRHYTKVKMEKGQKWDCPRRFSVFLFLVFSSARKPAVAE